MIELLFSQSSGSRLALARQAGWLYREATVAPAVPVWFQIVFRMLKGLSCCISSVVPVVPDKRAHWGRGLLGPVVSGTGAGASLGRAPCRPGRGACRFCFGLPKTAERKVQRSDNIAIVGDLGDPMIKQHRIAIVGAGLVGGSAALFAAYSILALKSF